MSSAPMSHGHSMQNAESVGLGSSPLTTATLPMSPLASPGTEEASTENLDRAGTGGKKPLCGTKATSKSRKPTSRRRSTVFSDAASSRAALPPAPDRRCAAHGGAMGPGSAAPRFSSPWPLATSGPRCEGPYPSAPQRAPPAEPPLLIQRTRSYMSGCCIIPVYEWASSTSSASKMFSISWQSSSGLVVSYRASIHRNICDEAGWFTTPRRSPTGTSRIATMSRTFLDPENTAWKNPSAFA
mmetsp:Transcript_112835/g.319110  ORF Transcript_112835/g.319110 Transcript_112835/m.319110 type:complete len:241 (-) Transcript_112835:1154-1876(-)